MSSSPRWLTTLIELRRQARTERRRQLDEAQRAADILIEQDCVLERETGQASELRRGAAMAGSFDINRLLAAQRHQAALLMEQSAVRQQLQLLEQEIQRRRAALIEAEKQVRTLEKLAERKVREARSRADLREAKRLDELASVMRKVGYPK
jgi:flagellar protein FliJ